MGFVPRRLPVVAVGTHSSAEYVEPDDLDALHLEVRASLVDADVPRPLHSVAWVVPVLVKDDSVRTVPPGVLEDMDSVVEPGGCICVATNH